MIVVIPYLSIIEQNARDYRMIFGTDHVLEHHCAVEMESGKSKATDADDEPSQMLDYERAIENWDVPIVVTTSVQFIESLFAAATGRARKLHNIARSVVIFDEVQTLPAHLLEPTLDVLRTLQKHFGVSVVFCSATQPAFRKSGNLKQGFREDEIAEIAPRVNDLFAKLQRVSYRIVPETERWDWNRVAAEMLRVLRPATGAILWYDFWFNPTNPDVRAIRAAEIRALFAGCDVTIQRITLAPPIARRLVGVSWLLCALLERIGILNTHQLALIRPK